VDIPIARHQSKEKETRPAALGAIFGFKIMNGLMWVAYVYQVYSGN
jgi:hypothetical protein